MTDAERLFGLSLDMLGSAQDGYFTLLNPAWEKTLGWTSAELMAEPFVSFVHPDDVDATIEAATTLSMPDTTVVGFENRYRCRSGGYLWIEWTCVSDLGVIQFVARDITDRRAADEALRASEERLMSILGATPDAVCVQDLQYRYLLVNDAFEERFGLDSGWALGRSDKEVLTPDAVILDREFHDRVVARGELVVQEQVVIAAGGDRVNSTARFPLRNESGSVYAVCSMLRDVTDLKAHEEDLRSRLEWTDQIHAAIAQDRFVLHGQPIIDLTTGEVEQAELLIRMTSRQGSSTLVPPGEFLPAAERFELIGLIDRWVVQRGLELAVDHRIELNLSGQTISDPGQVAAIERLVIESGAPPENIIFEITETAVVKDTAAARHFAERLRALGCAFALDDFGVGFGSFTYLKHLPVDYLKIDISFVRELTSDEANRQIVSAIVSVARDFGLETIAEGVEDQATLDLLREMGVDLAQGFWIGRPIPIRELWPTVPNAMERT